MISIAEHLVLVFAMLQWGKRWKAEDTTVVRYNVLMYNQNSYVWTMKGFSGCEVAHDLCRSSVSCAMAEIALYCARSSAPA